MQLIGPRKCQAGVTLVEILVGITVGIIVTGGAIVIYSGSVQNSNDILRSSRLNQEISSLMLVIANDVRRAGFWGDIDDTAYELNPFNQPGATALTVIDNMLNDNLQGPTGQGSCLTYTYDATYLAGNVPGAVESSDLFGFRLNNTVVQMREAGVVDGADCIGGTCSSCLNGTWVNVTDPDLIEITALTFDLAESQCLNASEPNLQDDDLDGTFDEADEYDCYLTSAPNGSGDVTVESREVLVTVTARLSNDPSTQLTASQAIRVRNDLLRIR